MGWTYTFRPSEIGSQMTITGDKPGRMIALALTEVQERTINAVEIIGAGPTLISAGIANNTLTLTLGPVDGYGDSGSVAGDSLPAGGQQYQVLQRNGSGEAQWDWVRAH